MTPFRWTNCYADVQASKHDMTIRSYFEDVIVPAIATLEEKISALGRSHSPGDVFAQADMEDVLREAKLAFGLSVQSIWERQFRAYLRGCAKELRPDEPLENRVARADWKDLQKHFRDLRGIGLDNFPSYQTLDTLQHLGNACRHGDGASAIELSKRCPDFWSPVPPMPTEMHLPGPEVAPSVAMMDIPVESLQEFVEAIAEFWRDAEYIYNESIERKHPSLVAKLAREREQRHWLPQATTTK
ncbi:hypothetical protein [Nitratireductor sp. StC3]|uniref:hypothetical protein n=1 Tax=Nitratireductor sp. StC3 TaxID=2126741 RepID=UPI000D0D84EF|nr:hypothetical protein [Nitratireductor sp. StC3]PSM16481.1 hypothetical protein C7T96_19310 [Nitratireductor sp. StC3]